MSSLGKSIDSRIPRKPQTKVDFSLPERHVRTHAERIHGVAFRCLLCRDPRPGRRCGLQLFVTDKADLQWGSFCECDRPC